MKNSSEIMLCYHCRLRGLIRKKHYAYKLIPIQYAMFLVLTLAIMFGGFQTARAQQACDLSRWQGVTGWTGVYMVSGAGSYRYDSDWVPSSVPDQFDRYIILAQMSQSVIGSINGTVVDVTASLNYGSNRIMRYQWHGTEWGSKEYLDVDGLETKTVPLSINFNYSDCTYWISANTTINANYIEEVGYGPQSHQTPLGVGSATPRIPLPESGTTLSGNTSWQGGFGDGGFYGSSDVRLGSFPITWEATWSLVPLGENSDIQVNVSPLNQCNPDWEAWPYDDSGNNICHLGCALTSLTMALNFAELKFNKPLMGELNPLFPWGLEENATFDPGHNIDWVDSTKYVSDYRMKFIDQRINSVTSPETANAFLDAVLAYGLPVIVGVKLDTEGGNPHHFVLVTGKTGNDYTIADPGGHCNTLSCSLYESTWMYDTGSGKFVQDQSFPNPVFETRGYVTDPPGDLSELDINIGDNADVLVTSPVGLSTGFDGATDKRVEQIPNSSHFIDALMDNVDNSIGTGSSHYVYIRQPMSGTYSVLVLSAK